MNDADLRTLLDQVIADLDAGRLRPPGRRPRGLARRLGPPLLAVGLGLGVAACDGRGLGVVEEDASVQPVDPQRVDAGDQPAYVAPEVDGGPMVMYGEPFEPVVDAGVPEPDGEPPNASLYAAPPP
jgi:hypothetical protein